MRQKLTGTTYTGSLSELLLAVSQTGGWCEGSITSVHQQTTLGDTPLHTICMWGFVEPVEMLIAHRADVNARGEHSDTPLLRSIMGQNPAVVSLLVRHGADPDLANDFGMTPRSMAVSIGKSKGWRVNPLLAAIDTFKPQRSSGHELDSTRT